MKYSKAELVYSKRRGQYAIVFIGKPKVDTSSNTFTREKEFLWETEVEFKRIKKQLGL